MGTNNRARRAAKQRRRRNDRPPRSGPNQDFSGRAQDHAADHAGPGERTERPSVAEIEEAARHALVVAGRRIPPASEQAAVALLAAARAHPGPVGRAVRELLEGLVRQAWEGGWQPADLAEQARRQADPAVRMLLTEAVAAEHLRYGRTTVDPRWQDQLDRIGVSDAPALQLPMPSSVPAAVGLTALLLSLHVLPRLLPLPGAAPVTAVGTSRAGVDEKVLGRIRGLLAKAEATEFVDEAEVLSAKAQELMARFSLDRALVDAGRGGGASPGPGATRLWLDQPYVSAKADLVHHVAAANRCRSVTYGQYGFVTIVGEEVDLQLTVLLATSLLVQASRAMLAAGSQSGPYGRSTTRSFRQSFLVAYAVRIGERLRAVSAAAEAAAAESEPMRLLPVLAARERQVRQRFDELFPHTQSRRTSVSNPAGWAAGRTAADLATLDVRRPLAEE